MANEQFGEGQGFLIPGAHTKQGKIAVDDNLTGQVLRQLTEKLHQVHTAALTAMGRIRQCPGKHVLPRQARREFEKQGIPPVRQQQGADVAEGRCRQPSRTLLQQGCHDGFRLKTRRQVVALTGAKQQPDLFEDRAADCARHARRRRLRDGNEEKLRTASLQGQKRVAGVVAQNQPDVVWQ